MTAAPALLVQNLSVEFRTRSGVVKALESVSFAVAKGETLAIVGESGSGKSVTAYAVMGILDPAGHVTAGNAVLGALDLLTASPSRAFGSARARHRDDLPEPARGAQSDPSGRPPDRRRADPPRQRAAPRSAGARHRSAARGRHPRSGAAAPRPIRSKCPAACASA